jgi:hypothetical protein
MYATITTLPVSTMPLMTVVCCAKWYSYQAAGYRLFMVRCPWRTALQAAADFPCKTL